MSESIRASYDVIVCGGGTAGSVVARRLAEDPNVSVLQPEADGFDRVPQVIDSTQWMWNIGTSRDWGYKAAPSDTVNGRMPVLPMGKVLGGGSSINGSVWANDHMNDFANWAAASGEEAWTYENTPAICHSYSGWAPKVSGETDGVSMPGDFHASTLREPVGEVAAIATWNFPLVLTACKLAPLLAAGCTAIIKPSDLTPLSSLRLAQTAEEVGVPPGVINGVTGYGSAAGQALVENPGVDKVAFTGSVETGKKIVQSATGKLKRVTPDLGGKSPMSVLPDADLEATIPELAQAIKTFTEAQAVCAAL